jgi:NADH-quinone oxidoreductase subunit A
MKLNNMTYFTTELKSIFVFVIASLVLSIILFVAVYIMSFTSKVEFEKSSAYECGFAPFSETQYPFEVQFALIAIMFLLFDIEVLYLYPLVTSVSDLASYDLINLTVFFSLLTVGIVFEISRNIMAMSAPSYTPKTQRTL